MFSQSAFADLASLPPGIQTGLTCGGPVPCLAVANHTFMTNPLEEIHFMSPSNTCGLISVKQKQAMIFTLNHLWCILILFLFSLLLKKKMLAVTH